MIKSLLDPFGQCLKFGPPSLMTSQVPIMSVISNDGSFEQEIFIKVMKTENEIKINNLLSYLLSLPIILGGQDNPNQA